MEKSHATIKLTGDFGPVTVVFPYTGIVCLGYTEEGPHVCYLKMRPAWLTEGLLFKNMFVSAENAGLVSTFPDLAIAMLRLWKNAMPWSFVHKIWRSALFTLWNAILSDLHNAKMTKAGKIMKVITWVRKATLDWWSRAEVGDSRVFQVCFRFLAGTDLEFLRILW